MSRSMHTRPRHGARLRRHLTFANIAAALALAASAGTTAWAAVVITGANIQDGTVTGADVRNGSITSIDIARATRLALQARDGRDGRDGLTGPAGAQGLPGRDGAAGAQGPQGLAGSARAYGLISWSSGSSCTVTNARNIAACVYLGPGNYKLITTVDISDSWPLCSMSPTDFGASSIEPFICYAAPVDANSVRVLVTQFWNNGGTNVKINADASFLKVMVAIP